MSEMTRPGGLTLLAIVTIVVGVLTLISPVGFFSMKTSEYAEGSIQDPEQERRLAAHQEMSTGTMVTLTLLALTQGSLLLLSARGYLLGRRVSGYLLGNVTALFSIGVVFFNTHLLDDSIDQGSYGPATVARLFFPVLTLGLLNLVFRRDLQT